MAESGDQRYHGLAAMHATIICLTRDRTGLEPLGQGAADLFSGGDAVALFDFLEGLEDLRVNRHLADLILDRSHVSYYNLRVKWPLSLSFQKLYAGLTLSLTRFVIAIILPA